MLYIVLLLKIIGIILASILGLLIFLILIVLLVPIRYRLDADNKDEVRAEMKISWLLRLIYIRIFYSDNQLIIRFHLFGKLLYDNRNPKYNKGTQKNRKKSKYGGQLEKYKIKTEAKPNKDIRAQKKLNPAEITKTQSDIKSSEIIKLREIKKTSDWDETIRNMNPAEEFENQKEVKAAEIPEFQVDEQNGLFAGIKSFFYRIKEFIVKIKEGFIRFKDRVRELKEKILSVGIKWDTIKNFLKHDGNKKALSRIYVTVRKLLKHIRPARLKLELEFGTGDPCLTGQILGAVAVFYAYYGKSMQVIPNFDEEILKGSVFCRGRIRLLTLLIICIQLILDENFRNLLKNFKTLKEDF